jgi:hypothetical protein
MIKRHSPTLTARDVNDGMVSNRCDSLLLCLHWKLPTSTSAGVYMLSFLKIMPFYKFSH